MIWIATEFTPEHKKAFDWLNDHTSDEIKLYGVQIELWQIDDSKPAIKFNLVSQPNEAVRQAAKSKNNEELSEKKKFQLDFWTKFKSKLEKTKKIGSLQSPSAQYWYNVALGKANIHLSNTCNTDEHKIGIRIYIGNKISHIMMPFLSSHKEEIEKAIGQRLLWDPNPENRDKVIVLHHQADFDNEQEIDIAMDWLVEYTIKFKNILSPLVQQCHIPSTNALKLAELVKKSDNGIELL